MVPARMRLEPDPRPRAGRPVASERCATELDRRAMSDALGRAPRGRLRLGRGAGAAAVPRARVRPQLHADGGADARRARSRRRSCSRCSGSGRTAAARCGCFPAGWRWRVSAPGSRRVAPSYALVLAARLPRRASASPRTTRRARSSPPSRAAASARAGCRYFNIGGNTGYALGPIVVTPLVLWLGLDRRAGRDAARCSSSPSSLARGAAVSRDASSRCRRRSRDGRGRGRPSRDGAPRRRDRAAQRRVVRAAHVRAAVGRRATAAAKATAGASSR